MTNSFYVTFESVQTGSKISKVVSEQDAPSLINKMLDTSFGNEDYVLTSIKSCLDLGIYDCDYINSEIHAGKYKGVLTASHTHAAIHSDIWYDGEGNVVHS